jgi:hypothetical protein
LLNARYYNGSRGQFLSEAPVFLGNLKEQNLRNPQSLNSYSYSEYNPIANKEPDGLLSYSQSAALSRIAAQLQGIIGALHVIATHGGSLSQGQVG